VVVPIVPTGQRVHELWTVTPFVNVPAVQAVQMLAPVTALKKPLLQPLQVDAPVTVPYEPAGQN